MPATEFRASEQELFIPGERCFIRGICFLHVFNKFLNLLKPRTKRASSS